MGGREAQAPRPPQFCSVVRGGPHTPSDALSPPGTKAEPSVHTLIPSTSTVTGLEASTVRLPLTVQRAAALQATLQSPPP